ncbi:carbamoyltransferase N-terminal domain-containing protein [Streptomyces polygonati]|uniref:Carbamoyltransferase N-terminal domain-containing protein n=1 Tax=Streptomyces polygonati TaxID=1617087 RepID=A0ABV8I020_9ACTN
MTLVCGIKLTHDGGIALIESTAGGGARLVAATEVEKHGNRRRHASLTDADLIVELLAQLGRAPDEVDEFVVDGWGHDARTSGLALSGSAGGRLIRTGPYRQSDDDTPVLHRYRPDSPLPLGGRSYGYSSFRHVESHLAAAYLTSPAAARGGPSWVLVWDGGVFPELYAVDPDRRSVGHMGPLFGIPGSVYSGFSCNVPPFLPDPAWDRQRRHDFHLTMPGKVMAYAGLGQVSEPLVRELKRVIAALDGRWDAPGVLHGLTEPFAARLRLAGADILASFQEAVARLLVEGLARAVEAAETPVDTLCFAGGSALNIKWNSAIRDSGLFDTVWVPPFPNDSGSAIGTACAYLLSEGRFDGLRWSVYSGPALAAGAAPAGWRSTPCSVEELGALLATSGSPVVVLGGRAELGPRALGHRSILASPVEAGMSAVLNRMKGRESYRPVAPICRAEDSARIFDPGGADPYMVFDHRVRPEWLDRIPAVVHVDGTARLQTVNDHDSPLAASVLRAFAERTGIPVLCNTSANEPGGGFFPDAASAMNWGRSPYVWADGVLHTRRAAQR